MTVVSSRRIVSDQLGGISSQRGDQTHIKAGPGEPILMGAHTLKHRKQWQLKEFYSALWYIFEYSIIMYTLLECLQTFSKVTQHSFNMFVILNHT